MREQLATRTPRTAEGCGGANKECEGGGQQERAPSRQHTAGSLVRVRVRIKVRVRARVRALPLPLALTKSAGEGAQPAAHGGQPLEQRGLLGRAG